MTRVLLVEDNPGDARLLQEAVRDTNESQIEVVHETRLAEAIIRAQIEDFDVMLLDLSLPDSKGMTTLHRAHQALPTLPIIILTGLDDDQAAVGAMEGGAQDYLIKGQVDGPQLVRSIRYALARHARAQRPAAAGHAGTIIGLLGVKGGCGTTTVACHLASELSRETGEKTLLADFDAVSGMVRFLFRPKSTYSVLDAAQNTGKLDQSFWAALITPISETLDVIAGPDAPLRVGGPNSQQLREVLDFVRYTYEWCVVDLGQGLSEVNLDLLEHIDTSVLVGSAEVAALHKAKHAIENLRSFGVNTEKLRLILNRCRKSSELTLEEMQRLIGLPIYMVLHEGGEDLVEAYTEGKLVEPASALGKGFTRLARKIAGKEAPEPKRGVIASLFS